MVDINKRSINVRMNRDKQKRTNWRKKALSTTAATTTENFRLFSG